MNDTGPEQAVARLARQQHGTFSRRQAREVGFTDRQIDRRIAARRWLRIVPAVFALPGNPATWERQVMAAVLAEPTALVSERSAAVVHRFDGFRKGRPHITVPRSANHRNPLAVVHRSDLVRATRVDGIPVTTIEQTVMDLAAAPDMSDLGAVIDGLVASGRTSVAKLAARHQQLHRHNRRGLVRVERLLAQRADTSWVPPASVLEAALHDLLDHPAVPPFVAQAAFPWRTADPERVDTLIEHWALIVEADGRTWHTRVADFARDRRRDHEALAHGHLVLRLGWEELVEDRAYALDTLLEIGARRHQPAVPSLG